ncbi:hypothetical protein BEH94_00120 [Candidatus Altiarchaeales archaeon WOR_SM1_SCG]|nr:hypothetical protein BEH94_00120 [Candidatus Altiarchaeales archaeon WOR_SM1_SCG]
MKVINSIKSKKAAAIIGVIILTGIFLLIYTFSIEPNRVETTHTEIKVSSNPGAEFPGCKLLVIADLHAAGNGHEKFLGGVVEEINKISGAEEIDAVIIGGDMIDYKSSELKFLAPLKNIEHKEVYAVLGNHDYGRGWHHKEIADEVEKYMENFGIDVMRNENRLVCGGRIRIVGIDSLWSGQYDMDEAFTIDGAGENKTGKIIPEVLISHNPDIVYAMGDKHPDLIISGHTHGGQVKFPFIGPVVMPSKAGRVCSEGLCEINEYEIYITRGVGGNPRIRFLSRPEISVIELV